MDEEERVLVHKKLLSDSSYTDLNIKIGSESIQAHAAIISCRCEDIIPFNQDEKSKKRKKHEVKLKDGTVKSAQIFQKILEYIYTGKLDFIKLTNEEILYINIGARNLNLTHLAYLCEKWIIENIRMDNIFHLLKASNDLNEARVKGFCLTFALQHYTDVISNKDGIKILGIELFQEVVASFNPQAVRSLEVPPAISSTFNEDFKRLYECMPYSDMNFILDGEQIKAHKSILASFSDTLALLFKVENAIQMERISTKAFRSCLRYLYFGDTNLEQSIACELVPFARKHRLNSLLKICEDKIRVNVSVETVVDVLTIAYTSGDRPELNEEIKSKAFPFLLENLDKVNLVNLRVNHPMLVLDLLFKLQEASKKGTIDLPRGQSAGAHHHHNNNNNNNNNAPPVQQQHPHQPSPVHHQPSPVHHQPPVPEVQPYTPPLSVSEANKNPLSASGGFGAYRKNSNNPTPVNTLPPPVPLVQQTPQVPPNVERREVPPPPMRAGRPPPPPRDGGNKPPPPVAPRTNSPAPPPRGLVPPPPRKS